MVERGHKWAPGRRRLLLNLQAVLCLILSACSVSVSLFEDILQYLLHFCVTLNLFVLVLCLIFAAACLFPGCYADKVQKSPEPEEETTT